MNNWIQNIKGQITELATEVLHDATEEGQVSASSELQVEKRKCAEAERLYLAERARSDALEKRVKDFEEQLFNTNEENDAIKDKFMGIVSDREQQIKRLNWEIERIRCPEEGEFSSINLEILPPKSSQISPLNSEVQNAIAKLKEKHECEMAAVISMNSNNIKQIREQYEERIRDLQSWTSSTATLEELDELKKSQEQSKAERLANLEEIRRLKALNTELMASYNEASARVNELSGGANSEAETILDFSNKIASLKSMLNETESRYELCKMEQTETGNRLELLMKEFADLRSSMHAAQANAEGTERDLMTQVHSLRDTLERTKADREKLITDFRESVRTIGEELTELKEYNQRLVHENTQLHESLSQLNVLRDALDSSNEELSNFREKFAEMQKGLMHEIERLTAEKDQLQNALDNRHSREEENTDERQCQTDEQKPSSAEEAIAEMFEQNVQLKAELSEREEELRRLRHDKSLPDIPAEEHCKRPSSDTDSAASNNDWERMGKEEIEVEGVSSSAGSDEKETTSANRRRKSSEQRDSATPADEMSSTKFDEQQLEERFVILEAELTKSKNRCEQLEAELSSTNFTITEGLKIKEELEVEINSKNCEIDKMRLDIAAFDRVRCEYVQQIDSLKLEYANLSSKFNIQSSKLSESMESLKRKLEKSLERNEHLVATNAELTAENERIETDFGLMRVQNAKLEAEVGNRNETERETRERDTTEIGNMHERNRELEAKLALLEQQIAGNDSALLAQERQEIVLLRTETEELQTLLQQKHSECQNYYEKMQEMQKVLEGRDAKLKNADEVLERREQEIALNRERIAKLEGEVQRLREHLLTVEELSSKDAIAAEERETDLRRQIRFLQEKSTTEGTSLTNSLEQYQVQVTELHANVAQLETEKSRMASLLTEKEKTLAELNKTLSNLQSVLKELANDQKMERQRLDAELWSIKEELRQKTDSLKVLEEAKTNLEGDFAGITHELNLSREQLLRKESLLEELENQLEEIRIAGKHNQYASDFVSHPSGTGVRSGAASSYKIDDGTLRQLFLSYFTSDKSKQPEIAIVMSRILGYSAEEQSQICEALSKAHSSSWFGFAVHPTAYFGPALVRPPIHSVPTTSDGNFLVGESPPVPTHRSSSSADLKSILEQ
uniref:Huntington interacting protein related 1 n=1 Tax=Globodera rostochiensis TaxID=31243 RepID=A0A914I804_GLORO